MWKRLAVAALLSFYPLQAEKRALNQNDYDSWRHIQNQILSNDGHYLAYALFPQQGDGELLIRDLRTNKEIRQPIGELPPPPPPDYSNPQREEDAPLPPGIAVKFSSDAQFIVFSTFPTHAAIEQAKLARMKAASWREKSEARPARPVRNPVPHPSPKGDLVIIQLSTGAVFRTERVKDFQLPSKAPGYVAYLQIPPEPGIDAALPEPRSKGKVESGDVVLRNLGTGAERRLPRVTEYFLTNDAKALVYAASALAAATGGVFALAPGQDSAPVALLAGAGRYEKLAWDVDQVRLAFLSDHDHPGNVPPALKLYCWDRHAASATELVSEETAGFPAGWRISGKAHLTLAKGGQRIFFGTAPERTPQPASAELPEEDRVSVDLWSWKDDYIQPMQKIRAATERARSYRAVYDIAGKKFRQLADPTLNDLLPSDDGLYAIGDDDRDYRRMEEYDADYDDSYILNTVTGERRLVAKKHPNRLSWSPTSKYAIYFNGKDWISIATADARAINLTGKLGVAFANEQNDTPGLAPSYRLAGWSRDGRFVLLYDRYDIWQCAPDGSSAVNLTKGAGRKSHLQFRLIRFENDDPASRWIDLSQPLLLRAENDQTHDTGFYEMSIGSMAPRQLVLAAKNFAPPIKARDADVYVTAASTFHDYPDLLVTDHNFRGFHKVTGANPQMTGLLWGTAELVHFNNADGVPLQATLYKPENFDPKRKYPLLVYIYERLTQNVNNFIEPRPYNTINPSVYVSNDYLVLEPDIVYKVGYPGQSALNCVLPAIQEVVNEGFVNEDAIGIQGHSWGGYQIAYMITRTNRFRAASAGAPVADMISAYDGIRWGPGIPRQFQYERTQSRIGGSVWEYPLRYIENSPIFMADRVNTPLLMIHNDADDAVPWYQGIEYYLALRRLNKEVYMFTYNGETHNLRRRPNQKDYALRLQQYFDYFLKGAPEPGWMKHGIPYLDKPGVAATLALDDDR